LLRRERLPLDNGRRAAAKYPVTRYFESIVHPPEPTAFPEQTGLLFAYAGARAKNFQAR
jgi:hypothetical protein